MKYWPMRQSRPEAALPDCRINSSHATGHQNPAAVAAHFKLQANIQIEQNGVTG